MPLVTTDRLLDPARAAHRGVGAFNVIQIEHAEAFVAAATRVGCGVVLQISQNAARWHGALEPLAAATLAVARAAEVPVAVHLDHVNDFAVHSQALRAGFTSLMFDADFSK